MKTHLAALIASTLAIFPLLAAEEKPTPPTLPTHPEAIQEFQDWRFGMFIHWGPVALKGTEIGWSRGNQVPIAEYDQLYTQFNPEKFDADEWARIAKEAGMKYLVLTTKHHDGFSLWPTAQRPMLSSTEQRPTPYSIAETPFKRDICQELADACKKHGIAFGTYYSIADWYHYDWTPRHYDPRPTDAANLDRYLQYLKAQCTELIEKYDTKLFWFDGEWFDTWTPELGADLYQFLRSKKDHLVINNRVGKGRIGMRSGQWDPAIHSGDYDTPEQSIGEFNMTPWETCMTIAQQWAWKPDDRMKSTKECIQALIRTNGGNGNFLFNVGPMPDGRIEPRQTQRLREMGAWLEKYGESLYATRGGLFLPSHNVYSTRKGNKIYLHFLNHQSTVTLPISTSLIADAKILTEGTFTTTPTPESDQTIITLSQNATREIDAIVEITLHQSAMEMEPIALIGPYKSISATNTHQNNPAYNPEKALDNDPSTRWATDAEISHATLIIEFHQEKNLSKITLQEEFDRVQNWQVQLLVKGEWLTVTEGKTIGNLTEKTFPPQAATAIRLQITNSPGGPTISEFKFE